MADKIHMDHRSGIRSAALWMATLAWLALSTTGLAMLAGYSSGPSRAAEPAVSWPPGTRIRPTAGSATLVMLAHPRCPCTRASIEELSRLMAQTNGRLVAHVVFVRPNGLPAGWEHTALWESAAAIPGVQVWSDPRGEEASHFGAFTSGQVFVYDRAERLIFSGGITAARGHAGDNAGLDSVLRNLKQDRGTQSRTALFGCSLRERHGSL